MYCLAIPKSFGLSSSTFLLIELSKDASVSLHFSESFIKNQNKLTLKKMYKFTTFN